LQGCFDSFKLRKEIAGPYYLTESESSGKWALYYDLGDDGLGRIDPVNKIGWTDKYIFAENNNNNYYFLDKTKDSGFLNANEIVIGPFSQTRFNSMLDSLNIRDFKFKIVLNK